MVIGLWSLVIGHWSLVINKEAEAEKGRQESVLQKIGFAICDLGFGIWDFSHLAVLGELGGLIFQDQEK